VDAPFRQLSIGLGWFALPQGTWLQSVTIGVKPKNPASARLDSGWLVAPFREFKTKFGAAGSLAGNGEQSFALCL
jgi:hypothetical protein